MKGQSILSIILTIVFGIIFISIITLVLLPAFSEVNTDYAYALTAGGVITVIAIVAFVIRLQLFEQL